MDRRRFVQSASGAVAALSGFSLARKHEPWGVMESVGSGVWAHLAAPLTDRTTLCNGGLIAGRDGVLMVEAFAGDVGARWVREQSRALAKREPTHVVLTHFHGDHSGGLRGARESGAALLCTTGTRDLVLERNTNAPTELLGDAQLVAGDEERVLDLGGRRLRLVAMSGHTPSDLAIVVEDAGVVFCGDLVWYGMFPNFVDAIPSRLGPSVRRLRAMNQRVYVSGHGGRTDAAGLDRFVGLLDRVEEAARAAIARGESAEEAGKQFAMPAGLEDWTLFNARYFERAIGAWMRELGAAP